MSGVEYYNQGNIECIDAIKASMSRAGFQDFCKGNVIKYLWRYRLHCTPLADLKKARDYLDWLIESVEQNDIHN
jgi:hypothetical protein